VEEWYDVLLLLISEAPFLNQVDHFVLDLKKLVNSDDLPRGASPFD
jgi:hypothetical protein